MDNPTAAPATAPQQPLLCIVNLHQGYPAGSPTLKLGSVCELPNNEQTREDIKKRHLILASADDPLFTPDQAKRVVAYQKLKTELAAAAASAPQPETNPAEDLAKAQVADGAAAAADEARRKKVNAILEGKDVEETGGTTGGVPISLPESAPSTAVGSSTTEDVKPPLVDGAPAPAGDGVATDAAAAASSTSQQRRR